MISNPGKEKSTSHVQQANQEMFKVIQQAQQENREMANKMIQLSIEQKVIQQKDTLANALVDLYL